MIFQVPICLSRSIFWRYFQCFSGEVILRDIPEQQRHMVASRSSNGSDYAMSPTGSGGSGVTTLRRQASELSRLNLDSFRSNWGTKTLTQPASSNIYSRSPVGTKPSPQSSNSTQNFGVSNGQCQGSPWINEYGSAEKNGIIFDENICNSKTYRDGTTFRTSTNLSDICKLWSVLLRGLLNGPTKMNFSVTCDKLYHWLDRSLHVRFWDIWIWQTSKLNFLW